MAEETVRNREVVMFTKRPSRCTVGELYQSLLDNGVNVSLGTILQYRPFFVVKPPEQEK